MHASSSIFLVIIALWAAFLVPGAIKRRRRTASARIADRDSAALRVVVRRPGTAAPAAPALLALEPSSRRVLGGSVVRAAASTPIPGATAARALPVAPAATRTSGAVVQRRRRLVLLLLAASVAGGVAGAAGAVPVLLAAVPALALLLVLAALARHGAARTAAAPVVVTTVLPAAPAQRTAPPVVQTPAEADVTAVLPAQREPELVPAAPRAEEGSWEPVAVPLPTYLLKPKAPERPLPRPVPAAAVHVDDTPTVLIDLREQARAVNE
ncbi:hypothetical protein [Kineococcus rubinsiae]|uniref:hypothetical protein n=1 Tax=Kineococcus rubinsiae TaxID=2609562 RepID=UPI00142FB1E1|nr:hypothetical protein [Kineococcus rubinsiae]NIZ91094.1 hypothetical protein [Kineococcus rubinsiae]